MSWINPEELKEDNLWKSEQQELADLRKQFEFLIAKDETDPQLRWELSTLVAEISHIHTKEQYARYKEQLEANKHAEVVDLLKRLQKDELANLQKQILNSNKQVVTERPNLNDETIYKKVADWWRDVSAKNVENTIQQAKSSWWILWKTIDFISRFA